MTRVTMAWIFLASCMAFGIVIGMICDWREMKRREARRDTLRALGDYQVRRWFWGGPLDGKMLPVTKGVRFRLVDRRVPLGAPVSLQLPEHPTDTDLRAFAYYELDAASGAMRYRDRSPYDLGPCDLP